jgi:hypothetical protein
MIVIIIDYCVLITQLLNTCCWCLSIVHSWLHLRVSLTLPVSLDCPFLIATLVFSNMSVVETSWNNDLENTTQKTKDQATWTPQKGKEVFKRSLFFIVGCRCFNWGSVFLIVSYVLGIKIMPLSIIFQLYYNQSNLSMRSPLLKSST